MLSGLSGYIKDVKNAFHKNATQAKPTLGRIRMGNREIDEIKLISQGGYAYVFQVKDTQTGEIFALKKMICQSPERFQTAKNEIKMLRSLPNHPNLLRVYDSSVETKGDCYYVYVLLEYCDGGSIFDLMAKYEATKLGEKQIIFIMREVCEGVKVLHSCKPPIAHRDLKIENVLLSNKRFKLCDFGSCSTSYVDFSKIPQSQYATYEEEYDKNTTLMYRPPEMCDPYQRQIVSEKVDVWMLGCILYTMCFYKHPFQEMTKLSIVNAAYTFPEDHPYPEKLIDLIRIMLTPHPNYRPDVFEICDLMNNYFEIKSVKLNPDAQRIREEQRKNANEMKKFENSNSRIPKFNGDIPIEELMKLQKKIQNDEDESPVHYNQQRETRQQQRPQQSRQQGKPHHHHFDSFDSFGQAPKRQAPEIQHFNSSPGLQQNNDWHNFGNQQSGNRHHTPTKESTSTSSQWESFGQSPPPKQLSSFAQFGSNSKSNTQSNNSTNNQWNNFNSVNSAPPSNTTTTQTNNNNMNNNQGNSWANNNWAPQNQQTQNNNFNAFNSQPNNTPQTNNTWNSFGGNNNNNQFQQNNNNSFNSNNYNSTGFNQQAQNTANFNSNNYNSTNGFNQQRPVQNAAPAVTNDLLDLADTKSKTPNIMDLYSMSK